jgi:hypothetical protein
MTKDKKILISIVLVVLIPGLCVISFIYGFRQGIEAGGLSSSLGEFLVFQQYMDAQMANADCAGAKRAINDYLDLVTKYKDKDSSFIKSTTYYGDKMLGHARLSRIERHLKNYTEADSQMEKAMEACSLRNWSDCSEAKLIIYSKKLEEKNPIACLANVEKK